MGQGIADKRIFLLINPKAGGGAAGAWWEAQRQALDEQGIDYFWEFTSSPTSAASQIRRAVAEGGAEAVLVAGGDGSLNQAVNGLIEGDELLRPDLIFGLCSVGSACDFARCAYGGKDIALQDLIKQGRISPIDVACCEYLDQRGKRERRYYINSFDMGAGADTCVRVNADGGRIKRLTHSGKLAFLLSALHVLLHYKYTATQVEADGEKYSGEYIIVGGANGKYIGGGMLLFPEARLDDGLLDLLLVKRRSKWQIFRVFPSIYSGRHLSQPGIVYTKAARIHISTARPLDIELDGEVPGTTEVTLSLLPGVLPLLQPDKD